MRISYNMNLLIIDEDLSLYDTIKGSSLPKNYIIYFSRAYRDIYSFIEYNNIHVVITDLDGKKKQGLSLLKKLKNLDPLVEVIFTGKPLPSEEVMGLINQGALDYLIKPLKMNAVHQTLKKIFEKRVLRRETYLLEKRLEKKYFFKSMIGKSPYMLEIFSLVENIAKYFSSVLITGETGTGKEMVARAIHELSPSTDKDLVICDCVSIPENLFESELFGYVKGAFTGADKDKLGLFDKAHRGTIFLDEIGEIPLSIQAKLLRVLEHHQFKPLGSNENRTVDVHVIAATSRNLRECITNGTFREDLLHRLNKVEIYIPPLRKRPEDIPLLVRHFLNRYNKQFSKKIKGVSRQVQKQFIKYEWPGNVRELENVMESAAMLCKKEFISTSDLPKYFQESLPDSEKIPFIKKEQLTTLKDLEKDYISYILKLTNNNLRKSAKIMNISRTTLYNKLKKYKINR